jgi:hypothetical protein
MAMVLTEEATFVFTPMPAILTEPRTSQKTVYVLLPKTPKPHPLFNMIFTVITNYSKV